MSTRLGSNTKPTSTQEWSGLNTYNQQAHLLTMPSGGPWKVSRLGGWLAGKDADVTAYLCIWNSSGTLLARSGSFTADGLAFGVGNSLQYEYDLTAPIQVAGSAQVYVGWSRNPAGAAQFGRLSSGTHYDDTQTGSYPGSLSGKVADGGGDIAAWLYYDPWNTAPNAPTLTGPANGATVGTTTPTLTFTHSDPNGDACASYDLQVDATTGNGVVPDWASPVVNVNDGTSGIAGNNVTYTCPALSRGQWYAWRAATKDPGGLQGPWSSPRYFLVNQLPTVTKVSPAAGNLAYIHNLGSDLAVWTSGGSHARPRLSWTFSDPQGGAQYAYQAKLYDAGGAQLWDSGKVISAALYVDVPYALVMGTTYQWSIAVWDQSNEKDAGGEAKSTFRVRWGQAIYEYNAGTGSASWSFTSGNVPANTSKALLFATATGAGGTGRSAWSASIGALSPANGPYLNVLVRLATQVSGTQPSLPDMTFHYIGQGILPDKWVPAGTVGDWSLDTDTRRYGTQSLKLAVSTTSGNRYTYPFTLASGDDIPVQPNTEYTLSAFVRTNGALKAGAQAGLRIYDAGTTGPERTELYLDATHNLTTDSNVADQDGKVWPEGWQRLRLTFRTDSQQDRLRPMLHYLHNGSQAGDVVWWDAVKLEEGTVATAWTPGFVGDPVVLDAGGVAVDASAGGIFRLRGSGGAARDTVELGDHGLLFGGDTGLYSPNRGVLNLTDSGGATEGGQVTLEGAGAHSDWNLDVYLDRFRVHDGTERVAVDSDGLNVVSGHLKVGGNPVARFVPLATMYDVAADATETATTDQVHTSAEITAVPTSGVVAVSGLILAREVSADGGYVFVSHYSGAYSGIVYGLTAYGANFGSCHFMVTTGGTNNRQIKYTTRAASGGTVHYYIRISGYWTTE